MKKKSNILPIIILMTIIFTGILLSFIIYFNSASEICSNKVYNLELVIEDGEDKYNSLIENDHIRFINNNLFLNKEKHVLKNETDSISLSTLINKFGKILVFRYSELNCMMCVDQELVELRKMIHENKMKIIIITTYGEMHDLFLFKRTNQLVDVDIYNIMEPFTNISIEKNNIPYYFVLDSDFILKDLFIPNKLFAKHSINYLHHIIESNQKNK